MDSKFSYRFSQRATDDLNDIVSYIAGNLSNQKAASDFVDTLQAAIDDLRAFPESSPHVSNEYLPDMDIRKKSVDNYILYYLPDYTEKVILILRIIYGRRNMDEIIRQLNI